MAWLPGQLRGLSQKSVMIASCPQVRFSLIQGVWEEKYLHLGNLIKQLPVREVREEEDKWGGPGSFQQLCQEWNSAKLWFGNSTQAILNDLLKKYPSRKLEWLQGFWRDHATVWLLLYWGFRYLIVDYF